MDKALSDLNEGVRLSPENWLAYTLRGDFYTARGNHALALQDYEKALMLQPGNPAITAARARALAASKESSTGAAPSRAQ